MTANSTIRMAFLAARPMSITRPICAYRFSSYPNQYRPRKAPRAAMGTVMKMLSGRDHRSYRAARIRKTKTEESRKICTMPMPFWIFCS